MWKLTPLKVSLPQINWYLFKEAKTSKISSNVLNHVLSLSSLSLFVTKSERSFKSKFMEATFFDVFALVLSTSYQTLVHPLRTYISFISIFIDHLSDQSKALHVLRSYSWKYRFGIIRPISINVGIELQIKLFLYLHYEWINEW